MTRAGTVQPTAVRGGEHSPAGGALRIGEVAARGGVSTRTLRYYEELGLISPSSRSPGGARRYSEEDVARLGRVRELQQLMGFNLDEIRTIVGAEDRLQQLRAEYQSGELPRRRQEELLQEAIEINDRLRARVRDKLARIEEFVGGLETKARRYRKFLRELSAES